MIKNQTPQCDLSSAMDLLAILRWSLAILCLHVFCLHMDMLNFCLEFSVGLNELMCIKFLEVSILCQTVNIN